MAKNPLLGLFEGTECFLEGTEFCGDLKQIVQIVIHFQDAGKKAITGSYDEMFTH